MRIGVLADRVGWEERRLLDAAREHGVEGVWVDDTGLCAGPCGTQLPDADVYLVRCRSYTRGAVLAGLLEDRGARVVNPARAVATCQDKLATARALGKAGLPVPDFRVVLTRRDLGPALDALGLPCVLKPLYGGLGRRVLLIRDRDLADAAYDYVEQFGQGFDRVLLAQRHHPGSDERLIVVGDEVIARYRRIANGDWRANVACGAAVEFAVDDPALDSLALGAAKVAGAQVCAVDLIVGPDKDAVVLEVNDVPLFRGATQATGADIAGRIVEHLIGGPR